MTIIDKEMAQVKRGVGGKVNPVNEGKCAKPWENRDKDKSQWELTFQQREIDM